VGIGTTSPSVALDVTGTINATTGFALTGNAAQVTTTYSGNTTSRFYTSTSGLNLTVDGAWPLMFSNNSTERMRIDSSGNLLVGTTDTTAFDGTSGINIGGNSNALAFSATGNNQMLIYSKVTGLQFYDATNNADRMLLDNSGNLLVGKTSADNETQGVRIYSTGRQSIVSEADTALIINRRTSVGTVVSFRKDATQVGTISVTGSATAYNTSSDQRLKDNIVDAPSASDDIDAIQVRSFDWKADGSHQKYGMVAQELQSVAPEAVSGDADSDEMMGVDYSKLVPMLVKEIQSLRARVAQLEGEN
jgi:hypothetical protein